MLGLQLCRMVTSYFQRHTHLRAKLKTVNTIVLDSIVLWFQIRRSRGQKICNGFERVVFDQIQPHKIGISDLRSPDSISIYFSTKYDANKKWSNNIVI